MLRGLLVTGEITNVRFSTGHSNASRESESRGVRHRIELSFLVRVWGTLCIAVLVEEEP